MFTSNTVWVWSLSRYRRILSFYARFVAKGRKVHEFLEPNLIEYLNGSVQKSNNCIANNWYLYFFLMEI